MDLTAVTPTLLAGIVFAVGAIVGLVATAALSETNSSLPLVSTLGFVCSVGTVAVLLLWPHLRRVFVAALLVVLVLSPVVVFLRAVHGFVREVTDLYR
jgi:uncharacterized membrane protein YoaK (UPF0700 family)